MYAKFCVTDLLLEQERHHLLTDFVHRAGLGVPTVKWNKKLSTKGWSFESPPFCQICFPLMPYKVHFLLPGITLIFYMNQTHDYDHETTTQEFLSPVILL